MRAWHVTDASEIDRILAEGMRPGSHWVTNDGLVDYFADFHEEPVVLEIDTDGMDAAALGFEADRASVAEPISRAIGKSDAQVLSEWKAVSGKGLWTDSVDVVGSFKAAGALPASAIRLRDAPSPRP